MSRTPPSPSKLLISFLVHQIFNPQYQVAISKPNSHIKLWTTCVHWFPWAPCDWLGFTLRHLISPTVLDFKPISTLLESLNSSIAPSSLRLYTTPTGHSQRLGDSSRIILTLLAKLLMWLIETLLWSKNPRLPSAKWSWWDTETKHSHSGCQTTGSNNQTWFHE